MIVTTYNDKVTNLDYIRLEVTAFIESLITEINPSQLQFNLIVDKSIKEIEVDSIISILRETQIKKIFRVYTNDNVNYQRVNWHNEKFNWKDEYNWKDDLNWYGVYK